MASSGVLFINLQSAFRGGNTESGIAYSYLQNLQQGAIGEFYGELVNVDYTFSTINISEITLQITAQRYTGSGSTRTLYFYGINRSVYTDDSWFTRYSVSAKMLRFNNCLGDYLGSLVVNVDGYTHSYKLSQSSNELLFNSIIHYLNEANPNHCFNLLISEKNGNSANDVKVTYGYVLFSYEDKLQPSVPFVQQGGVTVSTAAKGSTVTINTARHSVSYLHTLYYLAGDVPIVIGTEQAVGASVNWTIPTTLGDSVTIYCKTYEDGTQIGDTQNTLLVLTQAAGGGAPTINSISVSDVDAEIYEKFGGYVRGKSRLSISISATPAIGTTITGYRSTIDGQTYSGQAVTTLPLMNTGSRTLSVSVTGSTGDVSTETQTINVLDYTSPTLSSFNVLRCDDEGDPDAAGAYVKLTAVGAVASMSGHNDISAVLKHRLSGSGTDWDDITGTTLTVSGYDLNLDGVVLSLGLDPSETAYDFRIELSDYFTTITQQTGTEHKYPLLEFVKNQYAQFHVPVRMPSDSPLAVQYGGTGQTSLESLIQTIIGRIPTPAITVGNNYVILGKFCIIWGENTIYQYTAPKSTSVLFSSYLPSGKSFATAPKIMAMPEWATSPSGTAVISAMIQSVGTLSATLWIVCNSSMGLGTVYVPWVAFGILND